MTSPCDWFPSKIFQPRRYRPGNIGNWSGHLPFAHDVIRALRPACLVELGTHLGESYFGFCQAIVENQVACIAYAVDTWMGEQHAGFYDSGVYEEVQAYNAANYASFSYLLKSLFDDALPNFSDNSIDLLHIDGLHTVEAVSHDFRAWLPKVKPGGIVLLHDICARHLDFGVWKLWEKLQPEGETFAFHHSWGLGVFRKPGGGALESELLKALFEGSRAVQEQIRRYYTLAALELQWKHSTEDGLNEHLPELQLYPPSDQGYQEEHCQRARVETDRWQSISVDIPQGAAAGSIRVDPVERPAVIDIRGITLLSAVDQTTVWSSSGLELSNLAVGGTAMWIESSDDNAACRLFSYGSDPQIFLPFLDKRRLDQPLTFKMWVRLQTDLAALKPIITAALQPAPQPSANHSELLDNLQSKVDALEQQLEQERLANASIRNESAENRREHQALLDELNQKQTKVYLLEDFRHELKQENDHLREKFVNREKTYLDLRGRFAELEAAHAELKAGYEKALEKQQQLERTLTNVLGSRSWRLTSPLRSVTESIKGGSGSDKLS